jgi:hypothetical protein
MGSCASEFQSFTPNDKIVGQEHAALELFRKMKLRRRDVDKLYRLFRNVDRLNTGFIGIGDLFLLLEIESDPLILRMLSIFGNCTEETQIPFMEMVCTVSTYIPDTEPF